VAVRFVLTDYVDGALDLAVYDKLDDGTFAGNVPDCPGAIAFGSTLRECENELKSVLEDWIVVGLRLRHDLPIIAGIDLNVEPANGPLASQEVERNIDRGFSAEAWEKRLAEQPTSRSRTR
jgi:predicted RNase H-like HicB family nuclease